MPTILVQDEDGFIRYRPEGDAPLPTVVHVPGFNEDAMSHAPFALRLASAGFQCVALNPPWESTPALHNPNPTILFDLFSEGDARLARALARLARDGRTRFDWLALTGFSMGGMFVARTLAAETAHPFRGAVMVLATGDWSFMPRTTLDAFPDLQAVISPATMTMIEEILRQQSPVATPERFPPTPLLLLNADRDPRLPLAAAQHFHDMLRPAYEAAGQPDALRFEIHQGDRHEFRRAMQRQARAWLISLREGSGEQGVGVGG